MKIYTDGSFNIYTKTAGFGFVIPEINNTTVYGPVTDEEFSKQRNIAGEIIAVTEAIKYAEANSISEVIICHDYEGVAKWANGEWEAKNIYTQRYVEFIALKRQTMNISFIHIKGHSKDKYNDMADFAAKKGATGMYSENIPPKKDICTYILTIIDNEQFQFSREGDMPTNYIISDEKYNELCSKPVSELTPIQLIALSVYKSQIL